MNTIDWTHSFTAATSGAKVTDLIQAISAAAVAVFTFFLWRLSSRQTALLSASLHATQQSAEAAQKNAQTAERALIGVQRPILRLALSKLEIDPPQKNIPFENYATKLTITNIGKEPATIAASAAQFVPCFRPVDPPQPGIRPFDAVWGPTDLNDGTFLLAGDSTTFAIERFMDKNKGEALENFQATRGRVFVYGLIIYDDLMGFRREHGFCYGWDETEQAFLKCWLEGVNFDRITDPGTNPIVFAPPETRPPSDSG
jgi:hypothetical protein